MAVSLSLATAEGSVPVDYQLYLPEEWALDAQRRRKAKIPDTVRFATKSQIALEQIRAAQQRGVPQGIVLADAGYGGTRPFARRWTNWGLSYAVGVSSTATVWAPGIAPLPAAAYPGMGRPPKRLRRGPGHEPLSVKQLALALKRSAVEASRLA